VQKDSPIQTVADLKGKTVTLNKGSNVHYLLVKALEEAGLQYSDVQLNFMPPSEAGPAFEQGDIEVWGIWDPLLAVMQQSVGARVVRDGQGLVNNYGFYVASRKFAQENPELVKIMVEELDKMSEWAESNRGYVVDFVSQELDIDKAVMEQAELRHHYNLLPMSDDVVASQQEIADTFYKLGLIDKEIKVADVVWR
jgi:sulfonate transport system substrate-binding protein